jgi:hypothetical protein
LSEGSLTPAFNGTVYNYTVNVGNNVNFLTISATPVSPNATVTGVGIKTLQTGANAIAITVTAEDGVTQLEYIVIVNRAYNYNMDATLSYLGVSGGILTPVFHSAVQNYVVNIDHSITSVIISAISTDSNATVTGDGTKTLHAGANIFTISVTAEDGVTIHEYTVTINLTSVGIDELTIDNGQLRILIDNGQLIIDNGGRAIENVEVYDVMGRLVLKSNNLKVYESNSLIIDVSMLSSGVYLLKVISNEQTVVKRFVKQ